MSPKMEEGDVDAPSLTLEDAIDGVQHVLELFFENKFEESAKTLERHIDHSLLYKMEDANQAMCFAVMTIEKPLLMKGLEKSKIALDYCQTKRKVNSITETLSGWFAKTDYNDYTDDEAFAEVLHAKLNTMITILTFLGDQSLMAMVRVVKNLLVSHYSYKTCVEIMKSKTNWRTEKAEREFNSLTCSGYGMENLVMSHLPARVLKIISLVGFVGNRGVGLDHLHTVTDQYKDTHEWKITCFMVCMYSFYLEQFFGIGEADIPWMKNVTRDTLARYPNGCFDLFWSARLKQLTGHIEEAIELFDRAIKSQDYVKQMHYPCKWDMLWCYALKGDWTKAADCALVLKDNCMWSPASNAYQYACFMYMKMEEEKQPELRDLIDQTMLEVPKLRQRFLGKTIPPEKFAISVAEAYNGGDTELVLPALVLFYIWNVYNYSTERPDLMTPLLERIEAKMELVKNTKHYHVLLLLKGVCLRNAKRPQEALLCFTDIISNQDSITENYVPPHAAFELGMTHIDLGNYDESKSWLEKARDSYSGFLIESLVHLRIHGALQKLKILRKK